MLRAVKLSSMERQINRKMPVSSVMIKFIADCRALCIGCVSVYSKTRNINNCDKFWDAGV